MKHLKRAQRIAFDEVPATCETVADILGVLAEKYDIAEEDVDFTRKLITRLATSKLRDAQISNIALLLSAQEENRNLRKQIQDVPKITKRRKSE